MFYPNVFDFYFQKYTLKKATNNKKSNRSSAVFVHYYAKGVIWTQFRYNHVT